MFTNRVVPVISLGTTAQLYSPLCGQHSTHWHSVHCTLYIRIKRSYITCCRVHFYWTKDNCSESTDDSQLSLAYKPFHTEELGLLKWNNTSFGSCLTFDDCQWNAQTAHNARQPGKHGVNQFLMASSLLNRGIWPKTWWHLNIKLFCVSWKWNASLAKSVLQSSKRVKSKNTAMDKSANNTCLWEMPPHPGSVWQLSGCLEKPRLPPRRFTSLSIMMMMMLMVMRFVRMRECGNELQAAGSLPLLQDGM